MQHGCKTQHSTVTALHTLNDTVAEGFGQMPPPPARAVTVALDMSRAFDTINIHTLVRKLLQTNIPGTIIRLIANYIKGRKAYTTYRNHTSKNVNLKLSFHKVASFHPHYSTFTPQTYCHPMHRFRSWPMQMTSPSHPHTSTSAAKKYIQPYLQKVFVWTKQNNLILNPDKTTCTLFMTDPAEYTSNLDLKIHNNALHMATHTKVLGLTLDPKPTYSTHIHNISVHAHKPLQIIKALTAIGWGKQRVTHGYL